MRPFSLINFAVAGDTSVIGQGTRKVSTKQVVKNQKEIGEESKAVRQLGKHFINHSNRWNEAAKACNTAVKELGDFENYFQVLQREAGDLADMLEALAAQRAERARRGGTAGA